MFNKMYKFKTILNFQKKQIKISLTFKPTYRRNSNELLILIILNINILKNIKSINARFRIYFYFKINSKTRK